MTKDKKSLVCSVVALIVAMGALWIAWSKPGASFGAATTASGPAIEGYVSSILYNNGYVSAKDITTTANLNASIGTFSSSISSGTSSPLFTSAGDIVADSTGTSTLTLSSSNASRGSCLQLETNTGAPFAVYLVSTTSTMFTFQAGNCK